MKIKVLFVILSSFGVLGWSFSTSAAIILTDDFNSYNNGNIEGQGGWLGNGVNEFFTVKSDVLGERGKILESSSGFLGSTISVRKTGSLVSDGTISVDVKTTSGFFLGLFQLSEGSATRLQVQFMGAPTAGGNISYRSSDGKFQMISSSMTPDVWYNLQIEWRSAPSHQTRYRINGGVWSAWEAPYRDWVQGLDTVNLVRGALGNGEYIYFDAIGENPISDKIPVLIVPGITGTDLIQGSNLLWADLPKMILSPSDDFMDVLQFNSNLTSLNSDLISGEIFGKKTVNLIVGELSVFDYTFGLRQDLISQGYAEGENLFTFPYDWRYGVSGEYGDGKTNSDLLGQKIQDILAQTGASQIDVVAHSMGGLVVKKYAVEHPTNNYIRRAVFVGVPSTGAPNSVKALLQGDNLGVPGLNDAEIKKISENMPAIYDLLPSQQYYDTKGSYVKVIDQGFTGLNTTVKDLTHDEANSFLTDDHQLNSLAVGNAGSLHTKNFDNFDMRTAGIDLYAIDGCKAGTLGKITEVRSKSLLGQLVVNYKKPQMVPGDGTVPLESATNLPVDQAKKFYSLTGEHGKMLSQDGSRQQIVNLISGSTLAVDGEKITQNIAECKLNGKAISVYSPVDIFVTDQDGNEMGLVADGSIFNEIPNADFQIWGTHKFLYLPTDSGQIYDILMDGMGTGTYTIKSDDIENNEVVKTEVFSNLPVTESLTGTINFGETTTLIIQETSEGAPQTILPSAVVVGDDAQDVLPPVSVGTLDGVEQSGFYRSDVNIAIAATDDAAGVLAINYNIDSAGWQTVSGAVANVLVASEGAHSVAFFATDSAGNNEQEKVVDFAIDKTAPEIEIVNPENSGNYILGQNVVANWSVSDSLSGVDSATGTVPVGSPIDTLSVGTKNFTVAATDIAGNIAEKIVSYNVVYIFTDFSAPTTITKTDFKKMSTIPIKFRLKDVDGDYISTAKATLTVNGVNAISSGGANTGNVFKYDLVNQQYVFNLSAKSLLLGASILLVNLDDGTSYKGIITIK